MLALSALSLGLFIYAELSDSVSVFAFESLKNKTKDTKKINLNKLFIV